MILADSKNREVLFWYLIGNDLLETVPVIPRRCIIDFNGQDLLSAQQYVEVFDYIKEPVLAARTASLVKEQERNRKAQASSKKATVRRHHEAFFNQWWCLSYARAELIEKLATLSRYIVCVRTTKRPIFEFVHPSIHPGDALQVFTFEDDYSFGVLQSRAHWQWFVERCSTFKGDFRYTPTSVFDSFPWPQQPREKDVVRIAECGRILRERRREAVTEYGLPLRKLYRQLDLPGKNPPVRNAQHELDAAVLAAYGFRPKGDVLEQLFNLNAEVAQRHRKGHQVTGPGLPTELAHVGGLVTSDCVVAPEI